MTNALPSCWTHLRRFALLSPLLLGACSSVEHRWRREAGRVSASALRAHVEYLARPELSGRRTLAKESILALSYVQSILTSYNLRPELEHVDLRKTTVKEGYLAVERTRDGVASRLELEPGRDFVLTSVPSRDSEEIVDTDRPVIDRPNTADWLRFQANQTAEVLALAKDGTVRLAVSPTASRAIAGVREEAAIPARLHLWLKLAHAPVRAARLVAQFRGQESCRVERRVHVDGFGGTYAGAADSGLPTAILLEMARILAMAEVRPRCEVRFVFSTLGEWIASDHSPKWAPQVLWDDLHTPADQLSKKWDWNVLRRIAQEQLVVLGLGLGLEIGPGHALGEAK